MDLSYWSRVLRRMIILVCIPIRIATELFHCYVSAPSETAAEHEGETIDPIQMKLWEKEAVMEEWWGDNSPLSGLRTLNPIRVRLVAEAYLKEILGHSDTWEDILRTSTRPLEGARICDVGCGGGFLSETMQHHGAKVTGIDIVPKIIDVAKRHWANTHGEGDDQCGPEYICATVEQYAAENAGLFDVVVCSEVVEHVRNPSVFIGQCCKLVRPGGCVVFTTINRTFLALLYFDTLLEDLLGLVPYGTHHMYMFVKPKEVVDVVEPLGFDVRKIMGIIPGPSLREAVTFSHYFLSSCVQYDYVLIAKRSV